MTRLAVKSAGSGNLRKVVIAVAAFILIVAPHIPAPSTDAEPANQSAPPPVSLHQVATGFNQPLYVTHARDGSGRLYVVEKAGRIKVVVNGQIQATPFLDIDSLVYSGGSEQGLLGLAFHPSYATNGRVYVFYTDEAEQDDILARYQRLASDPLRADPASGRILLDIQDPYSNHNGGMLAFGPNGYLYVGTGDGGSAGDPENRAQDLTQLLGKLLRLDVDLATDVAPYYEIPPTNPYATRTDGTRREIWASGLRNPWRFSFDRQTGDLWIGDVGQGAREEINRQAGGSPGGQNYGWRIMEGLSCYNPSSGCNQSGLTLPIQDYDHSLGCSVTGGYVYRGAAIPGLRGHYVFGDYCSGRIWSLRLEGGSWVRTQLLDTGYAISSFGEDEAGELYLTDLSGGGIYRFAPSGAPTPTPAPTGTTAPTATSAPPTSTPTPGSGARADLVITAFTASPTSSDRPTPINVTVVNQGTAGTGPGDSFDIHVFADLGRPPTAGDTAYVGHIQVPTLSPGTSTTVTGEVFANALAPGSHTLWVLADGHDIVSESNEGNNSRSTTIVLGAPPTGTPVGTQAVTFDDRAGQNQPLNGQYPSGVIDWGTGQWWHSGPFGSLTSKNVSFTAGATSRTFTFMAPHRLLSLQAYNGSNSDTTVTLSCPGQPDRQAILGSHQLATITTGWTGTCTSVTIATAAGWDVNFDTLVLAAASTPTPTQTATPTRTPTPVAPTPTPTRTPTSPPASQTVTFDDRAGQNQPLNGQYPSGVIDWGTSQWWHSGPFGSFTTKSVSFTAGVTSRAFTFVTPRRLVSLQAHNGGGSTTITLSCAGKPTKTVTLAAGQSATIVTGWTGTCTTVTVSSSNGWDTNFDNLVHDGG
jgi:glucose/arabinose dehydrogenase